jgi:hypothetical protein
VRINFQPSRLSFRIVPATGMLYATDRQSDKEIVGDLETVLIDLEMRKFITISQ